MSKHIHSTWRPELFCLVPSGPKCVRLKEKSEADERWRCWTQVGKEAATGHWLQQSSAVYVYEPGELVAEGGTDVASNPESHHRCLWLFAANRLTSAGNCHPVLRRRTPATHGRSSSKLRSCAGRSSTAKPSSCSRWENECYRLIHVKSSYLSLRGGPWLK